MNLLISLLAILFSVVGAPPATSAPATKAPPADTAPAAKDAPATKNAPASKDSPAKRALPPLPAEPGVAAQREWTVDGVKRTAIVHSPAAKVAGGSPVIFVFHGHGGSSRNVERGFALHDLWPEAVVVYPQGLAAKTRLDPEGKLPGWQLGLGDGEDRDLKFFDAMLASLKSEDWVDPTRVYVTGHSNGGAFTYMLAGVRNDIFAAAAPSAGGTGQLAQCKPIPMMHLAGKADKIVPFEGQERMMKFMRGVNKCAAEGTDWAPGCKQYASEIGTPFVEYIHDGGHEFSKQAPALIVRFFKEHQKTAAKKPDVPSATR